MRTDTTPAASLPTLATHSVQLEAGLVRILDRRVFPLETAFVDCVTVEEVAVAIEQMVTQSSGPFFAASAGFVLAARAAQQCSSPEERREVLVAAAERLRGTRPTNNNIRDAMVELTAAAEPLLADPDLGARVEDAVRGLWRRQWDAGQRLGEHAAALVSDGDTILTHCWGESSLIDTLVEVRRAGKDVRVVCTETRPYLQGARLTAHSVAEMGFEVTVITDGMAAHAMDLGMVDKLVTAADRVTLSGHVINKVGTHQLAIAAHHFGIPFIAMVRFPDSQADTPADVEMEERDGEEVLQCMGVRTGSPLAKGWYPAFDVTPPHLVSAVATSNGAFPPLMIHDAFAPNAR